MRRPLADERLRRYLEVLSVDRHGGFMTMSRQTTTFFALLILGLAASTARAQVPAADTTPAPAAAPAPAADAAPPAEETGPAVVVAEEHAGDTATPPKPAPLPPWALTLRAGAFVLRSPGVPGYPAGPDVELSLSRIVTDMVSVEANAGAYQAKLSDFGTTLRVIPLTLSIKLTAEPENGFEPFAVIGLGVHLTRLEGGSLAATSASTLAFHAGLGLRYRFGARYFTGVDARYVFEDVAGPAGRLDGLRLALMGGALF
jgi:hypothetical protein